MATDAANSIAASGSTSTCVPASACASRMRARNSARMARSPAWSCVRVPADNACASGIAFSTRQPRRSGSRAVRRATVSSACRAPSIPRRSVASAAASPATYVRVAARNIASLPPYAA